MRLKQSAKNNNKPWVHNIQNIHKYNNNTKKDNTFQTIQNEGIYLNKILKKNLGGKKTDCKFPNFKENIKSFNSNIRNILSNEASKEKALKYVINMRNKRINSPFDIRCNKCAKFITINNESNNNNNFSKTSVEFYNPNKKKNISCENISYQDNINNGNNNYYNIRNTYNDKKINNDYFSRNNNSLMNQDKIIKVNRNKEILPKSIKEQDSYSKNAINTNKYEFEYNDINNNMYITPSNYGKGNKKNYLYSYNKYEKLYPIQNIRDEEIENAHDNFYDFMGNRYTFYYCYSSY